MEFVALVDDAKKGESFLGREIIGTEKLKNYSFDQIIVTAIESDEQVIESLLQLNIPVEKIKMIS